MSPSRHRVTDISLGTPASPVWDILTLDTTQGGGRVDIIVPMEQSILVRFTGMTDRIAEFVTGEFGPLASTTHATDLTPDISVTFVDRLPTPSTRDSFGLGAALADDQLRVVDGGAEASIDIVEGGRVVAVVENALPLDTIRRRVIVPCIALLALERGAVVIHGSATATDKQIVLLVGDKGIGKTSLVVGLVEKGHRYVGDDRLLLTEGGAVIALQSLVELRLDLLEGRPSLGRHAKESGWGQARLMRSCLRGCRGALSQLPFRFAHRVAGALALADDALSDHCFFVDSRALFAADDDLPRDLTTHPFLLTRGTPASSSPATPWEIEQWLMESSRHALEPLVALLATGGRTSPRWAQTHTRLLEQQHRIVASAASRMDATRMRLADDETWEQSVQRLFEAATTR